MGSVVAVAALWLAYLALTASLAPANLVLGLVIAAAAWHLTPIHPKPVRAPSVPGAAISAARYLVLVAIDVVTSGLQVTRLVFTRRPALRPGIVAIPMGCRSELATALSAHAITLAPGEVVVEIGTDGTAYTHCLDVTRSRDHVRAAQRLRSDLLSRVLPEEAPQEDPE